MSTTAESFVFDPSTGGLRKLKHTELLDVASHYKPSCSSTLKMDELHQLILDHLPEEELISYDEQVSSATLELKKLEFQENERARENTLHMKELEAKEKELATQVRLKELGTGLTPRPSDSGSSSGI